MPELPEVETIVRDLMPVLEGHIIEDVGIEWPGVLDGLPVETFRELVVGRRIERIERRAKYIIVRLSGDLALSIHLRMTGRLFFRPAGSEADRFTKAVFVIEGGYELRFADARKLGRILLLKQEDVDALYQRLGPEPLAEEFTPDTLANILDNRSTKIKALLLDQRLIAGIGNIYADESLFVAGIHPERLAKDLTLEEVKRLHHAIRQVLKASIINRGTTFSTFQDAYGQKGSHQERLQAYHRHGQPCVRCGAVLEQIQVAGRSTHFCPLCQAKAAAQPTKIAPSTTRTRSRRISGHSKAGSSRGQ